MTFNENTPIVFDQTKIEKYLFDLNLLKQDQILINNGWKIHFVIDFHQLFKYAFPFNDLLELKSNKAMPSSVERADFAATQASISFIFEKLEKCPIPIILPPHLYELRTLIKLVKSRTIINYLNLETLISWKNELFSDDEYRILSRLSSKDAIDDEILKKGYDILENKFADILFLITGSIESGLKKINRLFLQPEVKISIFSERWNKYSDKLYDFYKNDFSKSKWFSLFNKVRTKWDANYRDVMVIETILWLNKLLHEENKKEIVLLVSDASSMFKVLNNDLFPSIFSNNGQSYNTPCVIEKNNGFNIRILRDSKVFLWYLVFKGENKTETIKKINNELSRTYELLTNQGIIDYTQICPIYSYQNNEIIKDFAINKECSICNNINNCKVKSLLKKIEKQKEELQNISLFLNRDSYFSQFLAYTENEISKLDKAISSFINFIKNPNDDFVNEVKNNNEKLLTSIFETENDLNRIVENLSASSFQQLTYGICGYFKGIPHRVEFNNPKIKEILDRIYNFSYDDEVLEKKLIKELIKISSSQEKDIYNESQLLLALLFYVFEKYNIVKLIVNQVISMKNIKNVNEYNYLLALALEEDGIRNKNKVELFQALMIIQKLIDMNSIKPKYFHIKGRIIAQMIRQNFTKEYSYDDVLHIFYQGIEVAEKFQKWDKLLISTFHNNILYIFYLKGRYNKLDRPNIDMHVANIKELKRELWPPVFYDTLGVANYILSKINDDISEKIKLLKEGISFIDEAITKSKFIYTFPFAKDNFYKNKEKLERELQILEKKTS